MTSNVACWSWTKLRILASNSLVSAIGLPFESWYCLVRRCPSSSMSTAFEDVEPPSRPMTPRTTWPRSSVASTNLGIAYSWRNATSAASVATSGGAALAPERGLAAVSDERLERIQPAVRADIGRLVESVDGGTQRGVVLRVLRNENQLLERCVLRPVQPAGCPDLRDALAPARLKEREVGVGPAKQEDARLQRVAAREHREVLGNDRIGQRTEDLVRGNPGLDEVDDVRLGKDAAFGGHVVELRWIPRQPAGLIRVHARLDHALVNRGPRARGALVVHRGDRALVAGLFLLLKQND